MGRIWGWCDVACASARLRSGCNTMRPDQDRICSLDAAFFHVSRFSQKVFSNLWITAILHDFRRLERYKHERSRIEIRTFGTEFNKKWRLRQTLILLRRWAWVSQRTCMLQSILTVTLTNQVCVSKVTFSCVEANKVPVAWKECLSCMEAVGVMPLSVPDRSLFILQI